MRTPKWLGGVVVLGLFLPAAADEEKVAFADLPQKVRNAVRAKFPNATVVKAGKEKEEGQTIYEVALKYKGRTYDVSFKPDGTLIEVEKTIAVKELPDAVARALKDKYPRARIRKAEEVTRGDKVVYEVVVETAARKRFEVVLSPEGKVEKTEAKGAKEEKEKDER